MVNGVNNGQAWAKANPEKLNSNEESDESSEISLEWIVGGIDLEKDE